MHPCFPLSLSLSLSLFLSLSLSLSFLLLCAIRKRENRWTVKFDAGCWVLPGRNAGREEWIYDTASAHIAIFSFGSGERDGPVLKVAASDTILLFKFTVSFSYTPNGSLKSFVCVSSFLKSYLDIHFWNLPLCIHDLLMFKIFSLNDNYPDKRGL